MSTENDKIILARTIWGEARGESRQGKIAVASVILNRFKSKKWFAGATVADTCTFCVKGSKWHQFSCWNDDDPNFNKMRSLTAEQLGECYEVADEIISGRIGSNIGNCMHYHTLSVSPKWSAGKLPDYQIGRHLFYSNID